MTTEKEIAILFDEILQKHFDRIQSVAHEKNSQQNDEVTELLNEGIKKQIAASIYTLLNLFDEYIKPENAHIQNALELIPLFAVYGMWIGAQLGVTQEEYYKIVDYYLERYDLLEKE